MDPKLTITQRAQAAIERLTAGHLSHCYRCRRPWNHVDGHTTFFDDEGRGCFPLCVSCWSMLTPDERLPYYKRYWIEWLAADNEIPWEVIRAAVVHEVSPRMLASIDEAQALCRRDPETWQGFWMLALDRVVMQPRLPRQVRLAWAEWRFVCRKQGS